MTQFRLLRYVWPHWHNLITILGTMLFSIALNVARPWPTKLLVDQVLGKQPLPSQVAHILSHVPGGHSRSGLLLWVCISTVLIFLVGTVIDTVKALTSIVFGQRMTYDLSTDVFGHLQRLSLLFHSRRPVGDTISRVTGDPYCVQNLVNGALLPVLQSAIMLVTMFAIMWQLNATMTLLSLGVVPFLFMAIRLYSHPMKSRTRERRDLEGDMMSMVQQSLSSIPAVQAFTREERHLADYRSHAEATVDAYRRTTVSEMLFSLAAGLVTAVGTATMMYLGGTYALQGHVSVGTVLIFLAYLASLYGPLNDISYTASTVQTAAAQADRVLDILDTPIEVQDAPGARDVALQGYVRYNHVTFGYEANRPTLKDVSLEVSPGEVLAIVGPTGAGKTTLVNMLLRFFSPWSGSISVDGLDLRDLTIRSLRKQIAIVLQESFIFPMSIADNIAYGRPDATRDEIISSATAANADEFIRRLPDGYDTIVGERGTTLSGGEKQRLSIARAFLKDAPILILDEPTSALDARTEGRLLEALDRLMKGRTTLIIAHRLSTIRNAHRILVVDSGDIVETGTHAELIAKAGLYAGLYFQQMDISQHQVTPTDEINVPLAT